MKTNQTGTTGAKEVAMEILGEETWTWTYPSLRGSNENPGRWEGSSSTRDTGDSDRTRKEYVASNAKFGTRRARASTRVSPKLVHENNGVWRTRHVNSVVVRGHGEVQGGTFGGTGTIGGPEGHKRLRRLITSKASS